MIKPDIYKLGDLNTERITKYRKVAEGYFLQEGTVRDIFCKGAEWGIEVSERLNLIAEENIAYVIYNNKYKNYLNWGEYFTDRIKNARTFSSKDDAERVMNYYVKIYGQTDRKGTCDDLIVLPVEIQISLK
jgi:hypothetical protein